MNSVLIIDDEKALADVLRQALIKYNYNVETAYSGREGIKKFDENLYDLVITDIVMLGLDGNDVVQHIRESEKPSTPVIGTSGTPWLLKEKCFDAVLVKPFSIHTMLTTIEKLHPKETLEEIITGVQNVSDFVSKSMPVSDE